MKRIVYIIILACVSFTFGQNKEISIQEGSGTFTVKGSKGNENKIITVHYYKPKTFNSLSKVLLVIPGSGRNGDSYRDSWIEESEKHNILILSPSYPEKEYPYEDYHLGGIVKDVNTRESISFIKNTNQVFLDEDKTSIKLNLDKTTWIYHDFDTIFELATTALNSSQESYDIFGHSAGGQILHRFAILHTKSKANKIIAANSGSYTLTDFDTKYPFGIEDLNLSKQDLKKAFSRKLAIFVGELDNENETGGILLRSKTVDKQGLHRLARAKYFFKVAKSKAEEMGYLFNWELKVIPNVGHNMRKMGNAAGNYLYE
ncbi:hypothetical protein [uncultured Aquimarina sp.]|uniref:hypothetical protein n=1 Tax=uncultured Aquimarina sp. TaxID=575652 RepID=UPI002611EE82|nr:hypothetical protein [uncultured Aquimarina sp.]